MSSKSRHGRRLAAASLAAWLAAALAPAPAGAGKPVPDKPPLPVVGEAVAVTVVPDPDELVWEGGRGRWTRTVEVEDAGFIKPHFAGVRLRPGDEIRVRDARGRIVETLRGRGPRGLGSFWGLSVPGGRMLVELVIGRAGAPYADPPFRIDQLLAGHPSWAPGGFSEGSPPGLEQPPLGSVCPPEDFEDVICYQDDPPKWANITASVGVMFVGGHPATALFCSGATVSPLGFVLTNQHCIEDAFDCDAAEIVYRFHRTACNQDAPTTPDWQSFRCAEIVAQSPLADCEPTPETLDFSLVRVEGDPVSSFGSVRPDAAPLASGESLYIVQHPLGRPQEITHGGGADVLVEEHVLRTFGTLDTEPGSSGSPVFRESDHRLVALHHCGGCTDAAGNRAMLMSDLYPFLEPFLCTEALSLGSAGFEGLEEVAGNGNGVIEPGETWRLEPRLRNLSCGETALGVTARLAPAAGSAAVEIPDPEAFFGDIPAGSAAASTSPILFRIAPEAACGEPILLDLVAISTSGGGVFPDLPGFFTRPVGDLPRTAVLAEGFGGGVPPGWTVLDGGTGTGPAATWTTANPGGRTLLPSPPFAIADSDELGVGEIMDEQLISPAVDVSAFSGVELRFSHDFNWYELGFAEQGDVAVRSSATAGEWVLVRRYEGADASGVETLDISALAAGSPDLQVRFHYHDARFEWWWAVDDVEVLGNQGFVCEPVPIFGDGFESGDTSAWSAVAGMGRRAHPGAAASARPARIERRADHRGDPAAVNGPQK